MKFKVSLSAMLLVLLGSSVLWAGDPWKEKPYTEGTKKDVLKVLEKSPWAKRFKYTVYEQWRGRAVRVPGWSDRDEGKTQARKHHPFTVVWFSALTVREAFVRLVQLRGTPNEEEDRQHLSRTPEHYEIVVHGPFISSFDPLTEWRVKWGYLQPRRSKQKVLPVKVQAVRQQAGGRIVEVRFYFARNVAGKPTIGPNERKVEFHYYDPERIKVTFDLRKMVRDGKPDL